MIAEQHWREAERFKNARTMLLPVPKVLVIYTGGTIGMKIKNNVYTPEAGYFEQALRKLIILHDPESSFPERSKFDRDSKYLYLNTGVVGESVVAYYVLEYSDLIDSSCMSIDHYRMIAQDIQDNYDCFSGFIILHGTDTMAYTSSYLSFMLENLSKPVILTGSQIPIYETRSDARDNLIGALMLAGLYNIPEVTIYFNTRLLRGNRSTKTDSQGLHAFESPNYPTLATIDYNINVRYDLIRENPTGPFSAFTDVDPNIGIFRIFPSVNGEMLKSFCEGNIRALVLQTYGMGNVDINNQKLIDAIGSISDEGKIIVNCTQCQKGYVDAVYEAGAVLPEKGVLSGRDMTIECALAKLAYVFGHKNWSPDEKKEIMITSIRGELTEPHPKLAENGTNDHDTSVKSWEKRSRSNEATTNELLKTANLNQLYNAILSKDLEQTSKLIPKQKLDSRMSERLIGMFLCLAASENDVDWLKCWRKAGATLQEKDYCGKSPLDVAKVVGSEDAEKYLLSVLL